MKNSMDYAQILTIAIGIYLAICAIFYFMQDFFFFRPEILPHSFQYKYPFPFEEVDFEMEDGGKINGLHFMVPNSKGVVFYLKGNSKSVKGWGKFARDFVSKGYDFFMVDYRGFGKSSGKRTETTLYNDAQTIYKWLSNQYPEQKIIIYGRSMGSGIAARIASWNKPKMMIFDSPYYSFLYQVKRWGWWVPMRLLLKYQIRTYQYIKKIDCPIHIIHGNKDRLVSYQQSKMLQAIAPHKVNLHTIINGGHNNLPDFPEYHEVLYDILNDEKAYKEFKKELEVLNA